MDMFFKGRDGDQGPAIQHLAVGLPVPSEIRADATMGTFVHPELGIVTQATWHFSHPTERRVWDQGRWRLGILPAGRHGTILHVGFKLDGHRELSADHCYSAGLHRLRSGGQDVRELVQEGTLLVAIVVDDATGLAAAVRKTRLSKRMALALHSEFSRQLSFSDSYQLGMEVSGAQAAFGTVPELNQHTCPWWEHGMAEA